MRLTRPDIYNTVRDCVRHMQGTTEDHYQAMLRVMDYVIAMPERGLFLAPKGDWDGKNLDFEFEISGKSDSDYAKYKDSSKSITGCVTYLNGAPITYQSTKDSISIGNGGRNECSCDTCTRHSICIRTCQVTRIKGKFAYESGNRQ